MAKRARQEDPVPDPRLIASRKKFVTPMADIEGVKPAEVKGVVAKAGESLSNLRVSQQYFSREIAGKFSIGAGWGSGGASASETDFAIRYEALLESKAAPLPAFPNGEVYEVVKALGVTLDITVQALDSSVHFDVFSVSAAVQLQRATASYRTTVYPNDAAVLADLVPKEGSLDPDNYNKLMEGLGKVKDAIASNPGLTPQPYYRPRKLITSFEGELALAQSITFAMKYLAKRKSVNTAVEDAVDVQLDGTVVRLVYGSVWPEVRDNDSPPRDVGDKATRWLADPFLPM